MCVLSLLRYLVRIFWDYQNRNQDGFSNCLQGLDLLLFLVRMFGFLLTVSSFYLLNCGFFSH